MANRFFKSWTNRRRNPFSKTENPVLKQETGLVIPTSSPYFIQLVELPLKETPSSVIVFNVTDNQYMTEVQTSPGQGQFRVDYPEPDGEGTGLIEFSSYDAGKVINISYKGTGSPVVTEFLDAIIEDYKPIEFGIVASDVVKNSNDAEKYTITSTEWIKLKEIKINETIKGTLKVSWEMKSAIGGAVVQSKLCVNGIQIGNIKETSSAIYNLYYEIITGPFQANDLIQIWVLTPASEEIYIRNMRLCYSGAIVAIGGLTLINPLPVTQDYTLNVTNQL